MMKRHSHRHTRRLIHRMFTATLSASQRALLFENLDGCDSCATVFDTYQTMESALLGKDAPYTSFTIERVHEALVSDASTHHSETRPRLKWIPAAVAGGISIVAAVAFLILGPVGRPANHPNHRAVLGGDAALSAVTLTAKGIYPPSSASLIGIRVFAVDTGADRVREEAHLDLNDIITFTYTEAEIGVRYLALFGIQETGGVRWYYPDYNEAKSIPVDGETVDEPLGDGIDLSVNHRPGWLRIVAMFSDAPLDVDTIEDAVLKLRKHPLELKALSPLSLSETSICLRQYTIMVEINEGDDGGNGR